MDGDAKREGGVAGDDDDVAAEIGKVLAAEDRGSQALELKHTQLIHQYLNIIILIFDGWRNGVNRF